MRRALEGVRILALTHQLAGPFGGVILGDLGAEVIIVEHPDARKEMKAGKTLHGENVRFMAVNRNKKGISLDLRNPKALEVLFDLVKKCDVVFDNFRAGVMERLGIDYECLTRVNPRIIWCSLSAFGQTGPYRERPGADYLMQAYSGAMSLTGEPDGPPTVYGIPIADVTGGMWAALGIISALYARTVTGRGQRIDISLMDTQIALLSYFASNFLVDGEIPPRMAHASHPYSAPVQRFTTKDGYIMIMAFNDYFFQKLCRAVGLPDLADDSRFANPPARVENRDELTQILTEVLVTKTTAEWLDALVLVGVPVAPVYTLREALNDPQVLARNMVVSMQHPVVGEFKGVGNPIKFSEVDEIFEPAPTIGQHTFEILNQLLEYTEERIKELETDRAVFCGKQEVEVS